MEHRSIKYQEGSNGEIKFESWFEKYDTDQITIAIRAVVDHFIAFARSEASRDNSNIELAGAIDRLSALHADTHHEPLCPHWVFARLCAEIRRSPERYEQLARNFYLEVETIRNVTFRRVIRHRRDRRAGEQGPNKTLIEKLEYKEEFARVKLLYIFEMVVAAREGRKEQTRRGMRREMVQEDADRQADDVEATEHGGENNGESQGDHNSEGEERDSDGHETLSRARTTKRRRLSRHLDQNRNPRLDGGFEVDGEE